MNQHVATIAFTADTWRSLYEEPDGRQYVRDDDGERVNGRWFIPRDEPMSDVVIG